MSRSDATELGGGSAEEAAGQATSSKSAGKSGGLRNWRLRSKLLLVLIIPTLTALVLGGLRTADKLSVADEFQQTADQVGLAIRVTNVVHELQTERTLAVTKIASGGAQGAPAFDAQIGKVDRAVDELRTATAGLATDDTEAQARYDRGLQRLDSLRPLRAAANNSPYSDIATFSTYTELLKQLVQLGQEVTAAVSDRDLLRAGTATQSISEAKEFFTREDAALQIAALRNQFPGDLLEQTRDANAGGDAAIANFNGSATPERRQFYSDTVSGPEVDSRERIRAGAFIAAEAGQPVAIDVPQLTDFSTATAAKLRTVESSLLDGLRVSADDLAGSTTTAAYVEAGIVIALIIATLALMIAVTRLLLGPLRVLRTNALDIAYTRLPQTVQRILDDPDPLRASKDVVEPVPITTREEIGEVARSFDAVHEQAVRMAAEQAMLRENVNGIFVNLSRRSQRLVERQLGVIDRLEADEQDPDHLASLFELDHLATRLRRNGESLLVLSGAGLSKSVPRPVPAADVVGAAVSEIEQYARVEVGVIPDTLVQGRTIHDLVHLLAELLDNATYFSEPETKVTVRAVATRRDELAIQITDRGVGMSESQLADANQRLADPPDLDVSVTRRMGLYVVARLAKRHGIEVRLRENEDIEGGVVARVVVPAELLGNAARSLPPITPPRNAMSDSVPQNWMTENAITTALSGSANGHRDSMEHTPPPRSAMTSTFESAFDAQPSQERSELPTRQPRQPEPEPEPIPAEDSSAGQEGGLRPLDQPISLDDLVAGSSGGMFAGAPDPATIPAPPPARPSPAQGNGAYNGNGNGAANGNGAQAPADGTAEETTQYSPLALPKRRPTYTPPIAPAQAEDDADAAEPPGSAPDDVPTRRLPIYQSVLSRWFSEEDEAQAQSEAGAEASAPADAGRPSPSPAPSPAPSPTARPAVPAEAERPAAEPDVQERPEGAGVAGSWQSASDNGWQAAQALLDSKDEEITPAGLPKRVPNAYLVPGSVSANSGAGGSFTDAGASAQPEKSAQPSIARSATAARSRMASFQRGYKSGRHALKDDSPEAGQPDAVSVSSSGEESAENGVKE
ncbi:nitrate- and nitrite sensing domain-containing protein [Amycolatopsis antarctica]|uniref:sensor histidine kinase n=1 Tax=Amycolatopsis antarctica TaxID=1854586 RepID=UPI001F0AA98F|nr:nitrate- and nitrite sensing domain-containing protein [Amycolatopsis antarctica]